MAFPTSPTNGQVVVVNNVNYQYANTTNTWTRILTTANVITANTISVNGALSAAGNISTGNYFIGNGSLLTGIASGSSTSISNGTSNVAVASSGGNIRVNVGGTSNVVVWATTGEYVTGVISASGNITGGNISTAGLLAASNNLIVNSPSPQAEGGQLILAWANITATGQANSTWNIDVDGTNNLRAFYQNAAGATSVLLSASPSSNILSFPSTAGISVSGNVNAGTNYFIGNGSQLTGISGGGGGSNIANGTSNVTVVSSICYHWRIRNWRCFGKWQYCIGCQRNWRQHLNWWVNQCHRNTQRNWRHNTGHSQHRKLVSRQRDHRRHSQCRWQHHWW